MASERVKVVYTWQVRVVFEPLVEVDDGGDLFAFGFECVPCEELLEWRADAKCYECSSCQFALSLDDAEKVLGRVKKSFNFFVKDVRKRKGRRRWPWSVRSEKP